MFISENWSSWVDSSIENKWIGHSHSLGGEFAPYGVKRDGVRWSFEASILVLAMLVSLEKIVDVHSKPRLFRLENFKSLDLKGKWVHSMS